MDAPRGHAPSDFRALRATLPACSQAKCRKFPSRCRCAVAPLSRPRDLCSAGESADVAEPEHDPAAFKQRRARALAASSVKVSPRNVLPARAGARSPFRRLRVGVSSTTACTSASARTAHSPVRSRVPPAPIDGGSSPRSGHAAANRISPLGARDESSRPAPRPSLQSRLRSSRLIISSGMQAPLAPTSAAPSPTRLEPRQAALVSATTTRAPAGRSDGIRKALVLARSSRATCAWLSMAPPLHNALIERKGARTALLTTAAFATCSRWATISATIIRPRARAACAVGAARFTLRFRKEDAKGEIRSFGEIFDSNGKK